MTLETKDIKNYLHLYLGCEVKGDEGSMIYTLATVHKSGKGCVLIDDIGNVCIIEGNKFKPILRRLESMTEDEDQVEFPKHNKGEFIDQHWHPEGFAWLLSKGFDLFGLIDAGLAVEK